MYKTISCAKRLLFIAGPLMLSSLSGMAMLFFSRMILACYSIEAHNAAVEATNLGWAFIAGWGSLASIVQVFIAQHYGAQNYSLLGRFAWQMIWLSLLSSLVFIPGAIWGPEFFFKDAQCDMQRSYLFWMLICGPLHVLFAALSGFFVGQGKVKLIIIVDVVGNFLNCLICYLAVFGLATYLKPMGIIGAAIATNIALVIQVLMLAVVFFNSSNREEYGTKNWQFDYSLLSQCVRVGLPNSIFSVLEVSGWAIFYSMMASLGDKHLTIAGIVQNVLILFNFIGEGLSRSVSVLCGNAIGEGKVKDVFKYVHSGFLLMTFFALILGAGLFFSKEILAQHFLSTLSDVQQQAYYPALVFGLINVVIYKYLEGIRLVMGGALTAAADTFFLLIGGSFSIWLFMVIPIYQFVYVPGRSIEAALTVCSIYTLIAASLYAWRFYYRSWGKSVSLVLNPA